MKPTKPLSLCLALFALSGCSNAPPLQFYTLSSVDPTVPPLTGAFEPSTVGNLDLPDVIDRIEIVRRSGPNQVAIADGQRWAAPLDEMTRHVLQADLEKLLPPRALIVDDAAANDPAIAVVNVEIDTFDSDLAGHIALDAHWSIVKGNPATTVLRSSAHIAETANDTGFNAMADAMSRAAGDLAAQIATTLPRQ